MGDIFSNFETMYMQKKCTTYFVFIKYFGCTLSCICLR